MKLGRLLLSIVTVLYFCFGICQAKEISVNNVEELVMAAEAENLTIRLEPGTYLLSKPLVLKPGVTLQGAGIEQTVISHVADWKPTVATLPDPETNLSQMDTSGYLIKLADKADNITISRLTLHGPRMHGAIYGFHNKNLHIHHIRVQETLWSGIRTHASQAAKIHDCEFIDAGGKWKKGGPGVDGGISGGAIFVVWFSDGEISHNRFVRTKMSKENAFFGIKGRQAKRTRIHHNTIGVNFAIEFPFENDEDNEIDHNVCHGVISIPKHAGGAVPESGKTFHIHHNWMTTSYAIEFVRNGVEVNHNRFDFAVEQDGGNLISGFGKAAASGPASFHHNMISNPGRGVIWINAVYNNLRIDNNHIITRTTLTPRTEGLFGFNEQCDFSTISLQNNRIECEGVPRPLFRTPESYAANIANNVLINVADTDRYENRATSEPVGLTVPLNFNCGVHGEYTVNEWNVTATNPVDE